MATNFPGIVEPVFQKFLDMLVTTVRYQEGSAPPAAPNSFVDSRQRPVPLTTVAEVMVIFRLSEDGKSAVMQIIPKGGLKGPSTGALAIEGTVDIGTLAAALV